MVKNLTGLAICSPALIGGVVFATMSQTTKSNTQPKLPYDSEVRTYLRSVGAFLEEPPTNNVFGGSRVPSIHGQVNDSIPGYKQVKKLGSTVDFVSGTVGVSPAKGGAESKPRFRMIHRVNDSGRYILFNSISYKVVTDEVAKVAANSSGYSTATKVLDKSKVNIMTHAVKASDNSCSKCHEGKKKGDTVGYVYAAYTNLK